MIRNLLIVGSVITSLSLTAQASVIPLDISSAFNYDGVGTANETGANSGSLPSTLGDHNLNQGHSWDGRYAYTNMGSISSGTALADDGLVGDYQLGPYDNGTDYTSKADNAIAFQVGGNGEPASVSHDISLNPGQQSRYSGINLAFVNDKRSHSSTSYRTAIQATYTDGTSEMILDTGVQDSSGGALGGGEKDGQGGITNTTDNTTFTNQAPNYSGNTISPSLLLGMDHRLDRGSIEEGTAAMWELSSYLPVDSSKALEKLTIEFEGPNDGANRPNELHVFAISGQPVPEPASLVLLGLSGLVMLSARPKPVRGRR